MNKNIKYSQNFLTSEKVLNQIIKQIEFKRNRYRLRNWNR